MSSSQEQGNNSHPTPQQQREDAQNSLKSKARKLKSQEQEFTKPGDSSGAMIEMHDKLWITLMEEAIRDNFGASLISELFAIRLPEAQRTDVEKTRVIDEQMEKVTELLAALETQEYKDSLKACDDMGNETFFKHLSKVGKKNVEKMSKHA